MYGFVAYFCGRYVQTRPCPAENRKYTTCRSDVRRGPSRHGHVQFALKICWRLDLEFLWDMPLFSRLLTKNRCSQLIVTQNAEQSLRSVRRMFSELSVIKRRIWVVSRQTNRRRMHCGQSAFFYRMKFNSDRRRERFAHGGAVQRRSQVVPHRATTYSASWTLIYPPN